MFKIPNPGIWIPRAKISGIPESELPYVGRQNKKTNIEKDEDKKLRFGTMDLEACLSLFDVYLKFWSHRENISVS